MTVFLVMWDSPDPDVGLSIQGIYSNEAAAQEHINKHYMCWQSGGTFYVDEQEWEVDDVYTPYDDG